MHFNNYFVERIRGDMRWGGGGGEGEGGHLLFTWSAGEGAYRNFDLSNILERPIMTSPLAVCFLAPL